VTDAGRHRSRNEDAYLADPRLFAVADGMGGHAAGDVASQLAIDALQSIAHAPVVTADAILGAIAAADREITQRGSASANGMGTTVCGIGVLGTPGHSQQFFVFNVGDSRSYQLRDGVLLQLTHDHSVVQTLIDSGSITESEAEIHPERHVITSSLGTGGTPTVDWWYVAPQPGDRFLITSDGLIRELDRAEVQGVLAADSDPQSIADILVAEALTAGGRDNITVVVVEVTDVDQPGDDDDRLDADTNPRIRSSEATTVPPVPAPTFDD
jgi:protein phosphatase